MAKRAENPIKPCLAPIWSIKGCKQAVFLPCVCVGDKKNVAFNERLQHLSVMISLTSSRIA